MWASNLATVVLIFISTYLISCAQGFRLYSSRSTNKVLCDRSSLRSSASSLPASHIMPHHQYSGGNNEGIRSIFSNYKYYQHSAFALSAKESTVGVTFTSPVSGDMALKLFKKAVASSKIVYKARAQQRWETAADKLKRKRLQRDFMNKIERNNEAYMKRFESPIEYEGVP